MYVVPRKQADTNGTQKVESKAVERRLETSKGVGPNKFP
jgi:hypothetical protein